MQVLQSLEANGKGIIIINQTHKDFSQATREEIQWALANYLLVKGSHSYLALMGYQEGGRILRTPETSAPIGHALNSMYASQGVAMRDFSSGLAIVNPSSRQSFVVSLPPGIYIDLYGNLVDEIPLEPLSGIVLLRKATSAYLHTPLNNTNLAFAAPLLTLFP